MTWGKHRAQNACCFFVFLQATLYSHIGLQLEYYYSKFEASISLDILQQMPQNKKGKAPHS